MQHDEAKTIRKLRGLLTRLKQEKNVQNRELRTWLSADGYAQYKEEWAAQKDLRDELRDKPAEIIEYERRLKLANFTYNRAERFSQQGKHAAAKKLFAQSDTEFESVLTHLQEIVYSNPNLCIWFDRDTTWGINSANSLHPSQVPQVVTSKSPQNRAKSGGMLRRKMSKRATKIEGIERELERIEPAVKPSLPLRRSIDELLKVVRDDD